VLFGVRSFIEADLFDHNVPFDNTTPIYSDQSALKIRVSIRVRLKSCTILAFITENKENEHLFFANFTEGYIVKNNVTIRSTAKRFIYSMSVYE